MVARAMVPAGRREVRFSVAANDEQSVRLMGDFDAWGAGVAMERRGTRWEASLNLGHRRRVLNKFFLDGSRWVSDGENPNHTNDGNERFPASSLPSSLGNSRFATCAANI